MKFKIVKYGLCCLLLNVGNQLFGQANNQTMPSTFPENNNPTKLMPTPGDTLQGNVISSSPGVDQGTYIKGNTDTIRSSSTTQKKTKKTTSKK